MRYPDTVDYISQSDFSQFWLFSDNCDFYISKFWLLWFSSHNCEFIFLPQKCVFFLLIVILYLTVVTFSGNSNFFSHYCDFYLKTVSISHFISHSMTLPLAVVTFSDNCGFIPQSDEFCTSKLWQFLKIANFLSHNMTLHLAVVTCPDNCDFIPQNDKFCASKVWQFLKLQFYIS